MKSVGNFIKELRNERGWTQEELASKIHISREAISKWERGKSIPDIDTLKKLSEIFDVSIDELLSGKRNPQENVGLNFLKKNIKIKKILNMLIIIILLLLVGFLFYYFINEYKKINIYTITGEGQNFNVESGLFIQTNEKIYFEISNIYLKEDYKVNKMELLYNDDIILSTNNTNILFTDYKGYEEYFDFENINEIINNLYLKIYYDDTYEIIKLNFIHDYINNNLFFKKEDYISDDTVVNNYDIDNDYVMKIKEIYEVNDDDYFCAYNDIFISYFESGNFIILTVYENDKIIQEYFYYVLYDLLNYSNNSTNLSVYCTDDSDVCDDFFAIILESFSECN